MPECPSPYYDISMPISPDMPIFPGDPGVEIMPALEIAKGDMADVALLRMGSHTGTHIDAPAHMFPGGTTVDKLALDVLVGDAVVAEVDAPSAVASGDLEALMLPRSTRRLLLKTRNARYWDAREFHEDFVYLTPDAARWLVDRRVELLGFDCLSIERYGAPKPEAHHILLQAGVIIVEGLDLHEVPSGCYHLCCLPLKIVNGDGAPARAILTRR